jgi:hypothetical protein
LISKRNRKGRRRIQGEKIEIIPHGHIETKGHLDGILERIPIYLNEPLLTRIIEETGLGIYYFFVS